MSRELQEFSTMIDERFEILTDQIEEEGFWEQILVIFIWKQYWYYGALCSGARSILRLILANSNFRFTFAAHG